MSIRKKSDSDDIKGFSCFPNMKTFDDIQMMTSQIFTSQMMTNQMITSPMITSSIITSPIIISPMSTSQIDTTQRKTSQIIRNLETEPDKNPISFEKLSQYRKRQKSENSLMKK